VLIDLLRLQTTTRNNNNKTSLRMYLYVCVSISLYAEQQLHCVLVALIAFVYVLFPPIWQPPTPKMLCSTLCHCSTHSLTHLLSLSLTCSPTRCLHSLSELRRDAERPQLVSLRSQSPTASSFSCLRAVFECATGLSWSCARCLFSRLFL